VNFSGCHNPFTGGDLFEAYATILADAVLAEANSRFERIIFCCNERLASRLEGRLRTVQTVRVGHFPHDEFLQLLAESELLLSAPGITTTLEAIVAGTPIRYLLPQNYSQALMSEHYRATLGECTSMALSRFGPEFAIAASLPEVEGVARTTAHLQTILATRQDQIGGMVRELLAAPAEGTLVQLRRNIRNRWRSPGQTAIVSHLLAAQRARAV
jgi:hypothetical protein